jgi:PEP-CTERM motif
MKKLLMSTAVALGLVPATLASEAHAAGITVTGYSLPDSAAYDAGTVDGYNYYDGPVTLQTTAGDINVYCADLNHELQTGVVYNYGFLTENGAGSPISEFTSNRIGHIAALGLASSDGDMQAAAELAIWATEYNTSATGFADIAIQNDYNSLIADTFANTGYARVLIPAGNWPNDTSLSQMMVVGTSSTVPEPSTWAMMLLGFAGLSLAGYRKSRRIATAA